MDRYRIFRRGRTWYLENAATGKQTGLHTRDRREALRVLHAKHEVQENPTINVQIARAYLHVADAGYTTWKWSDVFRYIIECYEEDSESRRRWRIVEKDKAFDFIPHKLVAETRAEDFLLVLQEGTVSTNVYLRRVQNYALGMNWLIVPIVPKKLFPAVRHKRAAPSRNSSTSASWPANRIPSAMRSMKCPGILADRRATSTSSTPRTSTRPTA